MFKKFMVPLTVAISLSVLGSSDAQAKTCKANIFKAPVEGRSVAKLKANAQTKSRLRWKTRMTNLHGVGWASWALAENKRQACIRSGGKWRCVAHARPCHL